MKIAILGTRGIPNSHGGFEQFAEYFSVFLANKNYDVYVYSSHDHPYQESKFKGVTVIHCYDPEYKIGTVGQFIYDLNCILDSRKRNFDVILQLGYTSSSIWHWLLPKKPCIITNMDGLEWKRSKYAPLVRRFLKYAEKLAIKSSNFLISDSIGIQEYILQKYNKTSQYIAYGATEFLHPDKLILSKYQVIKHEYCIIIARLEPENNIETIIRGYHASETSYDLLIFGSLNDYGKKLQIKYSKDKRIRFVGANYNQDNLNNLRYFSRYYFHGHSVGGTNPSLLEAMSSSALLIANNNIFNKSVLQNQAKYFDTSEDIEAILNKDTYFSFKDSFAEANIEEINKLYNWNKINTSYENYMLSCIKNA